MKNLTNACIKWIQDYFKTTNGQKAIIGISGGKDSTVAAALCVKALGNENVIGVLMPNDVQSDIEDAKVVCKLLNINTFNINIKNIYSAFEKELFEQFIDINKFKQANINLVPRIRTNLLYTIAQCIIGCRVCNTSNKCELFVGWGTFGADTFGDFSPLGNLLVSEIVDIGLDLKLPYELVLKAPSDGLTGKTDEENLGVTYAAIEEFIKGDFNNISEDSFIKINNLHQKNKFKSEILNIPKFNIDEYTK